MPKRTVYTCDCCGVEYEEPNLFDNDFISQFSFQMHHMNECGEYEDTYSLKKTSDDKIYFCPKCTKQFLNHLKSFGFSKLVNRSLLNNDEIKL